MSMTLRSTAFEQNQAIPPRHGEDGADVSPELIWTDPPAGTRELALIVDDPDAPTPEPWVHWVIGKIPVGLEGIAEGVHDKPTPAFPQGSVQGKNSWGTVGYRGPAPPKGHRVHRYSLRLYA